MGLWTLKVETEAFLQLGHEEKELICQKELADFKTLDLMLANYLLNEVDQAFHGIGCEIVIENAPDETKLNQYGKSQNIRIFTRALTEKFGDIDDKFAIRPEVDKLVLEKRSELLSQEPECFPFIVNYCCALEHVYSKDKEKLYDMLTPFIERLKAVSVEDARAMYIDEYWTHEGFSYGSTNPLHKVSYLVKLYDKLDKRVKKLKAPVKRLKA